MRKYTPASHPKKPLVLLRPPGYIKTMGQNSQTPSFSTRLACADLRAEVEWLERAFGFQTTLLATTPDGQVVHAEMRCGSGLIHVASEWENLKAPLSAGGVNTQNLCVHLASGLDEHCARARAAGGVILQEPADQFHGDRTYRVVDPQGHIWSFSQKLREITAEELSAAIPGMKVWKSEV